jgi:outer membrane protein assembly factor BamB
MTPRSAVICGLFMLVAGQGLAGAAPPAAGGDAGWPQYRGVNRDGVATTGGSPLTWPAAGPRVVWKHDVGAGFSQLTVGNGAVFTGLAGEEQEFVVRLDGESGEEVWRTPIGSSFQDQFGNGPRSTPTLDGEMLYILSAGSSLHAVSTTDGAPVWSVDLVKEFGSQTPRFGYSPSPLVAGWLLLVEVGGNQDRSLVAFDKKTGDVVWSVLSGPVGYSSPVVVKLGGMEQIILPRGTNLTGLGLNGVVQWEYELKEPAIAMPVPVAGDRIFVSSMGDAGCALLQVSRGEEGYTAETVWENRNMRNHFNSSLVIGDAIYGFDNATLKSLDLESGEVRWAHRGLGKGSLIAVDDRLLVLSVKGEFSMVDTTAETYSPLGAVQALEGKSWTAPSYAGGRVYLRNLTQMTCLDLRG